LFVDVCCFCSFHEPSLAPLPHHHHHHQVEEALEALEDNMEFWSFGVLISGLHKILV